MRPVRVEVRISSLANPGRQACLEVIVDTGVMLSVVPRTTLESLNVTPSGTRRFRAHGGIVQREIAPLLIRYEEAVAGITVVFGEGDDPAKMGVTALGSLGYKVDTTTGTIRATEMLMSPLAAA